MSLKCGCKAQLFLFNESIDIFPKEWHVTIFVVDHNHDLLSPSSVRFLPANRLITEDDKIAFSYTKKLDFQLER